MNTQIVTVDGLEFCVDKIKKYVKNNSLTEDEVKAIIDETDDGDADTVSGHTVKSDVPENAIFTDTVYTHPNSGVTNGTYKSVTVDEQGHVISGTNPTTLNEYGITDAATATALSDEITRATNKENEISEDLKNYLPLSGGTMNEDARVIMPSSGLNGYIKLISEPYDMLIYADGIVLTDNSDGRTTQINIGRVAADYLMGKLSDNRGQNTAHVGTDGHLYVNNNPVITSSGGVFDENCKIMFKHTGSDNDGSIEIIGSDNTTSTKLNDESIILTHDYYNATCTIYSDMINIASNEDQERASSISTEGVDSMRFSARFGSRELTRIGVADTNDHPISPQNPFIEMCNGEDEFGDYDIGSWEYSGFKQTGTFAMGLQAIDLHRMVYSVIGSENYGGHIFTVCNTVGDSVQYALIDSEGLWLQTGSFTSSGADYAEEDGNPNAEDRVGLFVTFAGSKIRPSQSGDNLALVAVISADPAVVGDNDSKEWKHKYLRDVYGRPVMEDYTDDKGRTYKRRVLNPEYDETLEYTPRSERPEWDFVGLKGKLVVRDDGSCVADGFCIPSDGGIATASSSDEGFYVMERLDENHIKIYVR